MIIAHWSGIKFCSSRKETSMIKKGFENRFSKGDIVYWVEKTLNNFQIMYGIVNEQYSDGVYIDLLGLRDTRRVNGIPINEFKKICYSQKRKKLPKGWTPDTVLCEITDDPFSPEEEKMINECRIDDPEQIKELYNKGILVEKEKIFKDEIVTDITNEGYRTIARVPGNTMSPAKSRTIRSDKVYFTYEEAEAEKEAGLAEFERQAALSDEEWALELIEKDVRRYLHVYSGELTLEQNKVDKYMDFFKALPKVKDVEARFCGGKLQWKYCEGKAWKTVFIPD